MSSKSIVSVILVSGIELGHRFLRRVFFQTVASSGGLPRHVSFILDGNRRYARKVSLPSQEAHRVGFLNVIRILRYCAELGIPIVSIFAFSVDNFRRTPGEISLLMSLIREKLGALVANLGELNDTGVRIRFVGDLGLIEPDIRDLARRAEEGTRTNTRVTLLVCFAYSSSYELLQGVGGACRQGRAVAAVSDIERGFYMAGYPDPDLLVRTSGEWRMSNFFLWQSGACFLYAPSCLWPEFSAWHLLCAVVQYQKAWGYLRDVRAKIYEYDRASGCLLQDA